MIPEPPTPPTLKYELGARYISPNGQHSNEPPEVVEPEPPEPDDDAPPWWSSAVTAEQLGQMTFPPLRWLVPKLLPDRGVVLLAGAPKQGKSMLALGLAVALAHGGVALGKLPVGAAAHVLVVSLDDQSQARAQRRLQAVADGGPLPAGLTFHTEPNLGRGHQAAVNLGMYLDAHPETRVVVLDTIEHLRPPGTNGDSAYSADVRFLSHLRHVTEAYPVVIVCITHTRKPSGGGDDDPITAVTGTHGITGGADHLLVLSGKRGIPRRMLDVISRDDEDSRHVLTFTAHGLQLTDEDPDDPTLQMNADDATLYRALSAYGEQGATAKQLEPECEHVTRIGNRLGRMRDRGLVRQTARGVYVALQ